MLLRSRAEITRTRFRRMVQATRSNRPCFVFPNTRNRHSFSECRTSSKIFLFESKNSSSHSWSATLCFIQFFPALPTSHSKAIGFGKIIIRIVYILPYTLSIAAAKSSLTSSSNSASSFLFPRVIARKSALGGRLKQSRHQRFPCHCDPPRRRGSNPVNYKASLKSFHSALKSVINSSFFFLDPPLMFFSRAIASLIS